jgi:DNA-binding PadR family transcriptional regulator
MTTQDSTTRSSWGELSSTKRDLLVSVAVVSSDPTCTSCGTEVIDELRTRYGYAGRKEGYYVALTELDEDGLVNKNASFLDGREIHYELTSVGEVMVNRHRKLPEVLPPVES